MSALSVLLVLLPLAAAPGDPRTPERPMAPLDLSGIDLFWSTADRIADGERLTASDWDAFFSHPGYAVTESSGQRRSVTAHCMPAVFAPDGDVAAAKENPPEGFRVERDRGPHRGVDRERIRSHFGKTRYGYGNTPRVGRCGSSPGKP